MKTILTLRLTQSNQWVGVDYAARILLLNSPPMTGSVEKNKMVVMMTMMIYHVNYCAIIVLGTGSLLYHIYVLYCVYIYII